MYLNVLEDLLARVHPLIRRVAVNQVSGTRDVLRVTVHAPEHAHADIAEALRRSEPSLAPRGYSLDYAFEG